MRRRRFRTAAPAFLLAGAVAGGCGNHDFREAERGDGKYDLLTLTRKLEELKPQPLVDFVWIPFIHVEMTGFSRERQALAPEAGGGSSWSPSMNPAAGGAYPPGYRLAEWTSWGPLFSYWSARDSLHDPAGKSYEVVEAQGVLGRLWSFTQTTVRAARGNRIEIRYDLLFGLIPLHHRVVYAGIEPPDGAPLAGSALSEE